MTIYTVYGIKPNYVSDFTYRGVSLKVHRPVKFDGEKCSEDWQFSKDGIGVASRLRSFVERVERIEVDQKAKADETTNKMREATNATLG